MSRNGYVNATKMCNDEGKKFRYWLENQTSKDYISYVQSVEDIPADLIMIKNGVGSNDYRGTYVHPDLITHIAFWISSSFAHKVTKIMKEYNKKEENMKHSITIKEKDETIDKQAIENMSLKDMLKKTLENTERILSKNNDLSIEMSKLSLDNQITHEMLNIVVEDRVVKPEDKDSTSSIVIYESIDQGPNMFYIFRVQKRGLKAALKRYKADNPNAIKFYEIEYNPNSINYFQRFKQKYKNEIRSYYNKFELLGITKDQLKEFIEEINNEKYK
jgi:hypothetical protein